MCQYKDILGNIKKQGFVLLKGCTANNAELISHGLGKVLQTTEVRINLESKSLVTSEKAISPHTDHHRADLILWYCIEQTDLGGETLLVDAKKIYSDLGVSRQELLRKAYFHEHKVFPGDPCRYPMISGEQGKELFYYTPWMQDKKLCKSIESSIDEFYVKVSRNSVPLKLVRGDILVIDNKRILHGRHAISGSKNRHLRRYWIQTRNPTKGGHYDKLRT